MNIRSSKVFIKNRLYKLYSTFLSLRVSLYLKLGIASILMFTVDAYSNDIAKQLSETVVNSFRQNDFSKIEQYVISVESIVKQRAIEEEEYYENYGRKNMTQRDIDYFNLTNDKASKIRNNNITLLKNSFAYTYKIGEEEVAISWEKAKLDDYKIKFDTLGDRNIVADIKINLLVRKKQRQLIVKNLLVDGRSLYLKHNSSFYIEGYAPIEVLGKKFTYALQLDAIDEIVKKFVPDKKELLYLSSYVPTLFKIRGQDDLAISKFRASLINNLIIDFSNIRVDGTKDGIVWDNISFVKASGEPIFVNYDVSNGSMEFSFKHKEEIQTIKIGQIALLYGKPYILGGVKWVY